MTATEIQSLSNQFLVAMPTLEDPNFARTVTLICQHDENGALGIIINRTVESLKINDILNQFKLPIPKSGEIGQQPVYSGGPVHTELGLVLHKNLGNWESTLVISDELNLTSSRDVLEAVSRSCGPENFMLLLGYSGWTAGQLEWEIQQNTWLTVPADPSIIFEVLSEHRWIQAAAALGIDISTLTAAAGHA